MRNLPETANVPNAITVIRLMIAVISFALMMTEYWLSAAILILVAVVMDVLDGKVARRLEQVTKQGVYLDVMADKIVIISTFLIIGLKINVVFFYLGILMLIREYTMDTMRSIAASKSVVISADKFSKIKGVLFMLAMLGMIWNLVLYDNRYVEQTFVIIASVAMLLAYVTLVRFFLKYKNIILAK